MNIPPHRSMMNTALPARPVHSRPLCRRTLLRGLGVSIGLPLLEAMLPNAGRALAQSRRSRSRVPLRMAFVYVPNGIHMQHWTPAEEGSSYTLPPTLEPLRELRSEFSVLTNLAQQKANANGDGPGDHARAMATFLTGAQARKTDGADIRAGISVDQVAAAAIGKRTRFPSLEVGADGGKTSGNCDSGYSCAYSSTISWKTETQPVPKETDPRLIFERLFESGRSGEAKQARLRREKLSRSILDFALEDAKRVQSMVGRADQRKLDEYFTGVRELEQRIEQAQRDEASAKPSMEKPSGVPESYADHLRLLADLIVLAFQLDATRIATMVMANEGSNRSYPFINVPEGHHSLSHHQNDPEKHAKIAIINHFHMEQFAYLLDRLHAVREADGSLLDHSMIVYGSCIGDGNRHDHVHLPILLAGRGAGTLQPGKHIRYPEKTPLMNLYASLLERIGVRSNQLGDCTGSLVDI
jgi:hypothetical protein